MSETQKPTQAVASQEQKTTLVSSHAPVGSGSTDSAKPAAVRLVKIKALRDIQYKVPRERLPGEEETSYARAPYHLVRVAEGETAEVSEEIAAEYCDQKFRGNYDFFGERSNHDERPMKIVARAERVA